MVVTKKGCMKFKLLYALNPLPGMTCNEYVWPEHLQCSNNPATQIPQIVDMDDLIKVHWSPSSERSLMAMMHAALNGLNNPWEKNSGMVLLGIILNENLQYNMVHIKRDHLRHTHKYYISSSSVDEQATQVCIVLSFLL